ncbi:hypothetical protein crov009 [Cafeteria roenbergensis virus]|uniref:Uncharacterized protein n=1 Tax=Cafeteria roenbergensis virus (strain BV-PW1) TaxID=693272 RepID=E3T4C9_CROVB|nr:hypothetical protein crov009 [Cafeteria roenbergensis virus BV-PW1]ADO67042.1 hypothetical protein crov009 [Cafeteria roenbergensis virus BV-PW1]
MIDSENYNMVIHDDEIICAEIQTLECKNGQMYSSVKTFHLSNYGKIICGRTYIIADFNKKLPIKFFIDNFTNNGKMFFKGGVSHYVDYNINVIFEIKNLIEDYTFKMEVKEILKDNIKLRIENEKLQKYKELEKYPEILKFSE